MRRYLFILILCCLPATAEAGLVTYTITGTADVTYDGVTINDTSISVSVQIDNTTADSLGGANRGLFSGGTGTITLADFGVFDAALLDIDSVLLVDNGTTERFALVDSSRSVGLIARSDTSNVISNPNTLTGFTGPFTPETLGRRTPLRLVDGTSVTSITSPSGFTVTATPEPRGWLLSCLGVLGLILGFPRSCMESPVREARNGSS